MRNAFVAGGWMVEPSRNLLARGEQEVRVEPRLMDVLVYLAERADHVVSKEELIERVWRERNVTDDVQKREGALAWVNVDPGFEALRSDARFQQIAARVPRRN